MRLVTCIRKSVYPAALVLLLPLMIAAGSPGRAPTAPAAAPAAKYIGADAYSKPTWAQADTPGTEYYLGSLESEKFFYNNQPLPASDAATTYELKVPGCGAIKSGGYVYKTSALCIVVWNEATSPTGADLQSFLTSTLNDPHQIIMAFCNEPEFKGHHDASGCKCDPSGTVRPCNSAAAIIKQFEVESEYIRNFESVHNKQNVKVAEISWGAYYTHGTNGCSVDPTSNPGNYLVPHQYVDYYLVDVYEGGHKNAITSPETLDQDSAWNNWVTCTKAPGVARGIAEFAINCGHEAKSLDHGKYEEAVAKSFSDDDTYLKTFKNLEVWNLWDNGGCALGNKTPDEPDSVAAWQSIEAGN
jgi:hypothetical protein